MIEEPGHEVIICPSGPSANHRSVCEMGATTPSRDRYPTAAATRRQLGSEASTSPVTA